jgi:hypothetical protein
MLDIHEFLLDRDFDSASGDVGTFSELERPSNAGRFEGVRAEGGMLIEGGVDICCLSTGPAGSVCGLSMCSGAEPFGGVFGSDSRVTAGEGGACWRLCSLLEWWSQDTSMPCISSMAADWDQKDGRYYYATGAI